MSLRPADHNSAAPVSLDADAVATTVALLSRRIEERFPGSGLSGACRELDRITTLTRERAEWIARPILSLLAALYIQDFDDDVALAAVNDVEKPHHGPRAEDLAEADDPLCDGTGARRRRAARRDGRRAVTRQFLSACATPCRSHHDIRPAPRERTIASLPT